ncbi:Os01g0333266 [Oryza sativa Japonica Group]|uniref:Os01g0333266 protein n=1 Tax=Oryza sativa subsp. japonica TaxID=39947 RepID=A0A0P0V218_ORYSJ|nr:Os01g0333266 [Oryza sativa Japonica Group]
MEEARSLMAEQRGCRSSLPRRSFHDCMYHSTIASRRSSIANTDVPTTPAVAPTTSHLLRSRCSQLPGPRGTSG